MKNLIVAMFALILPAVVNAEVMVGAPAPDFAVHNWKGGVTKLSDYKNKIVVLEWYNPDCPFSKKHYSTNNMQQLQERYSKLGVIWLTVNSSASGKQGHLNAETALANAQAVKASPTALLLDSDGALGLLYGARTTPHMFIVDASGKLAYQGAIDDNDSARPETVKGAKNYVSAALDELIAGKPVSVSKTNSYGCSIKYAS